VEIVLVPGLWLDASSWDRVTPALERAGHTTRPLTLPGLGARDADRSEIGLADHAAAVVAAIDAGVDAGVEAGVAAGVAATGEPAGPDAKVAVVAHSVGCGVAHAAVDSRPDRVARVFHVGGFPTPAGRSVAPFFTPEDGELPLPEWSDFDEADLRDLDDAARAAFRDRAVPSPGRLATDVQQLADERRYDVPVTAVCPEYTAADLQAWVTGGEAPVAELARIHDVEYVDLPTGHWPQLTRPEDLAELIVARL
jgi:pimeloyl-ACP methyl ester carboxylesterase